MKHQNGGKKTPRNLKKNPAAEDAESVCAPEEDETEFLPDDGAFPGDFGEPDAGIAHDEAAQTVLKADDPGETEFLLDDGQLREMSYEPVKRRRRRGKIAAAVIAVFAALFVFAGGVLAALDRLTPPLTVDLDGEVRIAALGHPFLSRFAETTPDFPPDTSRVGEVTAELKFFGFLPKTVTVDVRDLTPPELVTRSMTVLTGTALEPEDFVLTAEDKTGMSFRFAVPPDTSAAGEMILTVEARDEGNNVTAKTARLTVTDEIPTVELGVPEEWARALFEAAFPGLDSYDYTALNVLSAGTYPVAAERGDELFFLGLAVVDTTPPTGEVRSFDVRLGETPDASDFVVWADDLSPVTVRYAEEPDFGTAGAQAVGIALADSSGNETVLTAELRIWDIPESVTIECGMRQADFRKFVMQAVDPEAKGTPYFDHDFNSAALEIGEYRIALYGGYSELPLTVTVEDTTPPEGTPVSHDILLGETLAPDDFIRDITDVSAVKVAFAPGGEPDFAKVGEQAVTVTLTDILGNEMRYETGLHIWDIPAALTVEYGTDAAAVADRLFANENSRPAYDETFRGLTLGEYAVALRGEYSGMTVTLTVEDTTPPRLVVQPATFYTGTEADVNAFVSSSYDLTGVTLRFEKTPDLTRAQSAEVTIIAADGAGNETRGTTTLEVICDEIPPVIYGVTGIDAMVGDTISYRKNVYATDNRDGSVNVSVDSSAVNTRAAGTYPVIYTAADSEGNTAQATAWVTVHGIDATTVNLLADRVLADIVTSSMTEREIAYAIYVWASSSIRYSTSTSYLMGDYVGAAYSGFTTYAGNCYIYYAVSAALMSEAGLENMMVQRLSTTNPHYWNLVKVDGEWYHFDTCPHYTNAPLTSFLLTDEEVAYYSTYRAPGYYSFDPSLYPATP